MEGEEGEKEKGRGGIVNVTFVVASMFIPCAEERFSSFAPPPWCKGRHSRLHVRTKRDVEFLGKSRGPQQALGPIQHTGSESRADVFTKVKVLPVALWHLLDPRRALCFGTSETETFPWLPSACAATSFISPNYLSS